MATITKNRRKVRRHRIAAEADVRIEFGFRGRPLSLPVLDISVAGLSFAMLEELEGVDVGTCLSDAILRLGGKRELHGDLIVMHVTTERGVIGALFYPATDEDLIRMKFVLAGIEAVLATD